MSISQFSITLVETYYKKQIILESNKMTKALLYTALMLFLSFLTSCKTPQRIYNPNAKFGQEPTMNIPHTGPIVDEPTGSDWKTSEINTVDTIPGEDQTTTPISHPFESSPVYFSYDSAVVGQAYDDLLKSVADYMTSHPTYKLTVGGHCDQRGSDEYNRALSERRALAVKQAIIAFGASDSQVNTIGYGEEKPAATGTDLAAYAKNRRADFTMFAK